MQICLMVSPPRPITSPTLLLGMLITYKWSLIIGQDYK